MLRPSRNLFCEAKEIRECYALPQVKPRFCFLILSVSKTTLLRCGTQFARYFGLSDFEDRYGRGRRGEEMLMLHSSRNLFCEAKEIRER